LELDWLATKPASRGVLRRSDVPSFLARVEALRQEGAGYVEGSRADTPFPALALSFSNGYGAVHQFASEDTILLLRGDGSLSATEDVELPVQDDFTTFTGNFVLLSDRAWDAVKAFVDEAPAETLGNWTKLWLRDAPYHAALNARSCRWAGNRVTRLGMA
jgi:hypothetical protein